MTKQEILEGLKKLGISMEDILGNIEIFKKELEKPEDKMFRPNVGMMYFCVIYDRGKIVSICWTNDDIDDFRFNHNNCFKTREEAEFALEKYKVLAELEMFAKENNGKIDWNNSLQIKHYIKYNYCIKKIIHFSSWECKGNETYFSSEELIEQAVELFGDRMKKYVCEVE